MATQLFLHLGSALPPDIHRGTNTANLRGTTTGWAPQRLATTRGGGANSSFATATVAGSTPGVEVQITSGVPGEWITAPLAADVTISGTITINLWALESSMNANVAINAVIERLSSEGAIVSEIARSSQASEVGTSSGVSNFTVSPTSTNMLKGERFRLRVFADDAGTMASGFTFTVVAGATSGGVSGDSYISFNETFSFASSTPAGTTLYLTDTAGPAVGSDDEREMWTSRGSGVVTLSKEPNNGFAAPVRFTKSAVNIEWYSRPLKAFTLGDLVRLNLRARENNASGNMGLRAELAVCDLFGAGAVVWGACDLIDSATIGLGDGAGTNALGELTTTEAAVRGWLAGPDVAVVDGQRLRLRVYVDDNAATAAANGAFTWWGELFYAGTSDGASGDSFITLSQSVTEWEFIAPLPVMIPRNQAAGRAALF